MAKGSHSPESTFVCLVFNVSKGFRSIFFNRRASEKDTDYGSG